MEDDDEFYDTCSLNSQYSFESKRRLNNRDYISLSRDTIYYSAWDLDHIEATNLESTSKRNSKVSESL